MTSEYLELVGLQVTFDNIAPEYKLVHYYRPSKPIVDRRVVIQRSYQMPRDEKEADIIASLQKVWKPVILSAWNQDTVLSAAHYLQFQNDASPVDLLLDGEWIRVP